MPAFNYKYPRPPSGKAQKGPFFKKEGYTGKSFFSTSASPTLIQTKLKIGKPGNKYEQEADAMANRVVDSPSIQRKCGACEAEEKVQSRAGLDEKDGIQTKSENPGTPSSSLESQLNASKGGGSPLPKNVKHEMSQAFGANFSGVRIHTNTDSIQMNRDLNAQAFTHGSDVYFNDGKYNPTNSGGKKLLAHELTHVVQQGRARDIIQRDLAIRPPRPNAVGRALTPKKMVKAIEYNKRFVNSIPDHEAVIHMIRDVLGISPTPKVIDKDFVNAIVDWQALHRLSQDGKLGPKTARPLFKELGAEGEGECELTNRPIYNPQVPSINRAGGGERTTFRFNSEFKSDPANKKYPSCCEIRQFIQWNTAATTSFGASGLPHGGFPSGHPVNTWIEDRDSGNNRYGHRSGRFSDPQSFDQYLDNDNKRNQALGHKYRGSDSPGTSSGNINGRWRFLVKAIDVCNGNKNVGAMDIINVNW